MNLCDVISKYKTITHIYTFCDVSTAGIEQALIDLGCIDGTFTLYCHKVYYLETIRCIAELMCFIDLQGSASSHVVICDELDKDMWICGYSNKAIFSGGA